MKRFPNISLRDLDPEGLIRNEEIVGLRDIELLYIQKEEIEAKKAESKARAKAKLEKMKGR